MQNLPNETLVKIISYLKYTDLISCCYTCKQLRDAAEDSQVWRSLCLRTWRVSTCPSNMSWKENFAAFFKDYGRYIDIYAQVRKAWDDIEDFTEEQVPHIYESLQDGLSDGELDSIERQLKMSLPDSLRCVYRIHNGQRVDMAAGHGLFGSMQVYNVYITMSMCDVRDAVRCREVSLASRDSLRSVLNVAKCHHSGITRHIVLSDEEGMRPGEVHCPAGVLGQPPVAAYNQEPASANTASFIISDTYLNWFTIYATNLANHRYPALENEILDFLDDPSCEEWTGNIRVKVSTRFCPEQSSAEYDEFFYAYRVEFSMAADAPETESCKLRTRHWVITDEEGHEERVDGPGVIGEYPVMRPGAHFVYCSCTTFATTYGTMGGHFTFKKFSSGALVDVKCPTFHMKCLPYETANDRRDRLTELKKSL